MLNILEALSKLGGRGDTYLSGGHRRIRNSRHPWLPSEFEAIWALSGYLKKKKKSPKEVWCPGVGHHCVCKCVCPCRYEGLLRWSTGQGVSWGKCPSPGKQGMANIRCYSEPQGIVLVI